MVKFEIKFILKIITLISTIPAKENNEIQKGTYGDHDAAVDEVVGHDLRCRRLSRDHGREGLVGSHDDGRLLGAGHGLRAAILANAVRIRSVQVSGVVRRRLV